MKEGRIKVTIDDNKRIPTVGKGPIRTPICITISQYNLLKKLGFNVKEVGDLKQKTLDTKFTSNVDDNSYSEDKNDKNLNDEQKEESLNDNEEFEAEEALGEESTDNEVNDVDDSEEDEETLDESEEESEDEELNDKNESEEEDSDEELDEDDESEEEEEEFIDVDSLTKAQIKEKLDELGVSYGKNDKIDKLKNLLIENLPEE